MRIYDKVNNGRDYIVEIHIADIHFGAIDPAKQFNILQEQFLNEIAKIDFDILSIDGDIFDRKYMANSDAVFYAMEFVRQCVQLCMQRGATMIIIAGTESHDAGQLKLFHNYEIDPRVDVRIVENARFEYAQGLKILCIPEEYGKGEQYYRNLLDEIYDTAFVHGTVVNAVIGANKEDLDSTKYPVFSIGSFAGCKGPIVCGHVHKAMCLSGYIYYCSNPIRYRFGEEAEKGYCILLHGLNGYHSMQFMPIESFRYDTIDIKTLQYSDPNIVIHHLDNLLAIGIDNIRLDFSNLNEPTIQAIIEQYYSNNPNVVIKRYSEKEIPKVNTTEEIENKYSDLAFLLDPTLDEYSKFVQFINYNKGEQYITVEKLKAVLSGDGF